LRNSGATLPLVNRIIKNTAALWTSQAFHSLVSLGTVAIIARYLGVERFGDYGFVLAVCNIFQVITDMGANQIFIREVARHPAEIQTYFTANLTIMSVLGTLVFFLIIGTVYLFYPARHGVLAAAIGAAAVILLFVSQLFSSVFQATERMVYDALMRSLSYAVYLVFVIVAVLLDGGIVGIFIALLIQYVSACVVGYGFTRKYFFKPRLVLNRSRVWEILREAWPIGVHATLRKMSYRIDILFLKALSSRTDLGLFNGMYRIILQLQFIPRNLTSALFPVFSRLSKNEETRLKDVHSRSAKFLLIGCVPMVAVFLVFPEEVISIILGKAFLGAVPLLRVLAMALILLFFSTLFVRMLNAVDKQRWATACIAVSLGINMICDILLIPSFGFMGAGIATLASEVVLFVLTGLFVVRYLMLRPLVTAAVKLVIAGAFMALVWVRFGVGATWFAIIIGGFSYPLLLWVLHVFDDQESLWLHDAIRKLCGHFVKV
jgi:O-antigen/teichoic acid export membrane protein